MMIDLNYYYILITIMFGIDIFLIISIFNLQIEENEIEKQPLFLQNLKKEKEILDKKLYRGIALLITGIITISLCFSIQKNEIYIEYQKIIPQENLQSVQIIDKKQIKIITNNTDTKISEEEIIEYTGPIKYEESDDNNYKFVGKQLNNSSDSIIEFVTIFIPKNK